jgi:hypothetical protein
MITPVIKLYLSPLKVLIQIVVLNDGHQDYFALMARLVQKSIYSPRIV